MSRETAPKFLTLKEAAELARCSTMTLRRAIHAAQLQAYKPARILLIKETDILHWINSNCVTPLMDERLRK